MNAALFKTRILKNIFHRNECDTYSFFMGALLQSEIDEIIQAPENNVIIAGRQQIKTTMTILLRLLSDKTVMCVSDETAENAPSMGAVKIYECKE